MMDWFLSPQNSYIDMKVGSKQRTIKRDEIQDQTLNFLFLTIVLTDYFCQRSSLSLTPHLPFCQEPLLFIPYLSSFSSVPFWLQMPPYLPGSQGLIFQLCVYYWHRIHSPVSVVPQAAVYCLPLRPGVFVKSEHHQPRSTKRSSVDVESQNLYFS